MSETYAPGIDFQKKATEKTNPKLDISIGDNEFDELIVDQNNVSGPSVCSSIQEAIDKANRYTKIKLKPGIYRENIIINKPFIEIDSIQHDEPAILLSDNSPCIKIKDIGERETVKITNIRIANRGIKNDSFEKETDSAKKFFYRNSSMIENLDANYTMDSNVIEGVMMENRGRLTAISVYSGVVNLSNCQITLAYLTTFTNIIVHAIYVESACVILESVLIKGNKEFLTTGLYSYNSNCKLVNCKIMNHRSGGILFNGFDFNRLNVNKTNVFENVGCGIVAKGPGEIIMEDNLIEKNNGVGIKIIGSKKISVVGNKIIENTFNGSEFTNCDGLIMLNSCYKNKGCGILLEAEDGGEFNARVMKNLVIENVQNGIIVQGEGNEARILKNEKIACNNLAGICIRNKANPTIDENTIFENMHQGVLIVSGSSANLTNNSISKNIKANIALGGELSQNTRIKGNKIFQSRNEGIFLIDSKETKIQENEIYENNDGIILINSNPEIIENTINNNTRAGLFLLEGSSPIVKANFIRDNQFIGLFIRDDCKGVFEQNDIRGNPSQVYLKQECKELMPDIEKDNIIDGRTDIEGKCTIF